MNNFEFTEQNLQALKCSYCTNPYSLVGLCQNYHYVCCDCQKAFPTCPICSGFYLPPDNLLLDTILGPVNEAKQICIQNPNGVENLLVEAQKVRVKKSPVEKCKEHVFLGIWEGLTEFIFSGLTGKSKKKVSLTEFMSKILSKVTRKMGRSVYNWVLLKNPDKKTLQVSLGLLAVLIGCKLSLEHILKGSGSNTPTIINIPAESFKKAL